MATTTNFGWETPDDTDLVKDGAAAMRTLGSSIDTSLVDLKGGTTGQLLAKNTNTDMDFVWTAPGLSASIFDAKGDLIAATAADTASRLAVGTNNQVLTADSTTATGLKWATPATGWTLITSGTLSSTTTTVSGISGAYTDLKILFIGMVPSSAGANISITYNNTDNVYNPGIIFTDGSDTFGAVNAAATNNRIGNAMATTGTNNAVQILMQDYARANGWKRAEMTGWNARNGGNDHWFWYQQRIGIASAITRFDVTATAGNLSGNYYVYGI